MKRVIKLSMGLILASSILLAEGSKDVKPTISEESLGLRKVSLYSEDKAKGDTTKYNEEAAGTSKVIERAFQDAPPMIPHSTEGLLPITIKNNMCTSCHMPEVAPAMKATPIPASHFTDFRPLTDIAKDGKISKNGKAVDNTSSDKLEHVTTKESKKLVGARFNCTLCHAPQSKGDAPKNNFKAEFTTKDGATKSSWSGSSLTEGLDTLKD
ncbi:MAG: nitrate reductase cytochrome c-type subunit [Campylobacterota bacterium]|nr:nitrate reductase cytochrome c-type subunit [Campylobacterota bacterium]